MIPTPLDNCPFCGSDRITTASVRDGRKAECQSCFAKVIVYHGTGGFAATDELVREKWNRRAPRDTGRQLPDRASHTTGWSCKRIDGRWCIGMTGNLDTVHDAVLYVHTGRAGSDDEARKVAEWVAERYTEETQW